MTDSRYELDGTKAKTTQFECRKSPVQHVIDRVVNWAERLRAGIERIRDQLVEALQLDVHSYLNPALTALQASRTNRRGRLDRSVNEAGTGPTDDLTALIETIESLGHPSAIGD